MRHLPTIILAIFAIGLGGLALVYTGEQYRDAIFGVPATKPGKLLFDVKELDRTREIRLATSKGAKATFKLSGNQWKAESPWKDRADPLFIRTLFQYTAGLRVQEVIPKKGLDLHKFGLSKGSTKITMLDAKGDTICSYRLGRQAAWHVPTEDGKKTLTTNYIRLVDSSLKHNIYLCSTEAGQIKSLFNNDFARFRDHHAFYFSHKFLDKTRIQNDEGEVVISRDDLHSAWNITKPLKLRVDPKSLSQLFTNLARLTAIKVEDRANVTLPTAEDDSAHSQEIAIHSAGVEEDFVLRIYPPAKEDDTVALATVSDRPDTVFYLPLTSNIPDMISLSQFETGVNDLRSKTMTHLNGPQLKSIIIRPHGRPDTLLTRTKKTTWRVLRKKGYEAANENAVIDLMTAVTRDKVEKFVTDAATDLSPYGLNAPIIQLGFLSFNNEGMRLAIGREPKGDKIYAHIVGKPNIWKISYETLGKISIHPWQWRTSHVWHIPPVDIKQIEIEKKGQPPVTLDYSFFTEQWKATRGKGSEKEDATSELNPHRANTLLGHLESLTTNKWIGPVHPQAANALKTPDTIIRIHIQRVDDNGLDAPPITKTLKIAHTKGNLIYFAKVETTPKGPESEGEESYFLLNSEMIQKLYVKLFE
jgi:hypothetical protein